MDVTHGREGQQEPVQVAVVVHLADRLEEAVAAMATHGVTIMVWVVKAHLEVGSRRRGGHEDHRWDPVVQGALEAQEALGDLVGQEDLEVRLGVEAATLGAPCASLMATRQAWRH